jgi:hypothetical protein
MEIARNFSFRYPGQAQDLLRPDLLFGHYPPFAELELREGILQGALVTVVPLLGEVRFPFRSRLVPQGHSAHLEALRLDPEPELWAELEGEGWVAEELNYWIQLRLHAQLPAGEKWGGKALRKMAESAFERTLQRWLASLAEAGGSPPSVRPDALRKSP